MTDVTEVGPKLYRLSTFVPEAGTQFNQFLAHDEEPLLFHTGPRRLYGAVRQAVGRLGGPATIRGVAFSHFEADECGALRQWQHLAPEATAACSLVAKVVGVDDGVAARPARPLKNGEVLATAPAPSATRPTRWKRCRAPRRRRREEGPRWITTRRRSTRRRWR